MSVLSSVLTLRNALVIRIVCFSKAVDVLDFDLTAGLWCSQVGCRRKFWILVRVGPRLENWNLKPGELLWWIFRWILCDVKLTLFGFALNLASTVLVVIFEVVSKEKFKRIFKMIEKNVLHQNAMSITPFSIKTTGELWAIFSKEKKATKAEEVEA